jgi:hypothetical protein
VDKVDMIILFTMRRRDVIHLVLSLLSGDATVRSVYAGDNSGRIEEAAN